MNANTYVTEKYLNELRQDRVNLVESINILNEQLKALSDRILALEFQIWEASK